jgi:hypothetical protein
MNDMLLRQAFRIHLTALLLVPVAAWSWFCLATRPLVAADQPKTTSTPPGAESGDSYLRHAHPTIRKPFVDLLNLAVPVELEDQRLAALGYVDVTRKPFSADPTGKTDSTTAIQAAVVFARDHQMACFFQPGTYLLSDTLTCVQQLYKRANGRVFGGNRFPNMLVGSRAGARRPRLVLAPKAAGFGDAAKPKVFVRFCPSCCGLAN